MSEADTEQKNWYVVQAHSGFEKSALRSLKERIALNGLEDKFGQILVPTEEVVEIRNGVKRKSERKFYPGYVLVEMILDDETWYMVTKAPRIIGFVGGRLAGGRPEARPLSAPEVDEILSRVFDSHEKPKPKTLFEPGEEVRVIDGPFADFNGAVERVDYDRSKIHVSVSIFGRVTPVELDFDQVEKA